MATLMQHGPYWLALVAFVFVVKWILGRQYCSWRDDQKRGFEFFSHAQEALDLFSNTIIKNQSTIMVTIRDSSKESVDLITDAVRTINSDANAATAGIILALGIKENHTVQAIERLLIALREDLATARAMPPACGVGSQVRNDGGKVP